MKLIITRPAEFAREMAKVINEQLPGRYDIELAPLMHIEIEQTSLDLTDVQALLFTSRQAVAALASLSPSRDIPALCVGPGTAADAMAYGFSAISADGDVAALSTLAATSYVPGGGRLLYFRGTHISADIASALRDEGIEIEERIIYNQRALPLPASAHSAILGASPCVITLFSARTAEALAVELQSGSGALELPSSTRILSISANCAAPLQGLGAEVQVADTPDLAGMLKLLA